MAKHSRVYTARHWKCELYFLGRAVYPGCMACAKWIRARPYKGRITVLPLENPIAMKHLKLRTSQFQVKWV